MIRRIVSGVFLLIALGALGVIIAGALSSGEQLIVRFLTAIIVAALALYVVSDMRLQANDNAVAAGARATVPAPRITAPEEHPPNSTAAFMATVTGKRTSGPNQPISADEFSSDAESLGLATDPALESAGDPTQEAPIPVAVEATAPIVIGATAKAEDDESPYATDVDEASLWPFNDSAEPIISDQDQAELDDVDGLVAMFTKQSESELSEKKTLSMAGSAVGAATPGVSVLPSRLPDLTGTNLGSRPGHGGGDDGNEHAFGMGDQSHHDGVEDDDLLTAKGDRSTTDKEEVTEGVQVTTSGDSSRNGASDNSDDGPEEEGPIASTTSTRSTTAPIPALPAPDRVVVTDYAEGGGIAPIIDLHTGPSAAAGIEAAIRSGEYGVVASLIEQGLLSTDGPITDRDVRTMVYVAFTSSELRKILLAGGSIDGDNSNLELGEIDVFGHATGEVTESPKPPPEPELPAYKAL